MATVVLNDATISIDGDLYPGTSVAISYNSEAVEVTPFGSGTRINYGGTKTWAMEFEFLPDDSVVTDLFALVGMVVPVIVKASSAATSATNPAYQGDALVTDYTPLSGGAGERNSISLSVVSAGDLELVAV